MSCLTCRSLVSSALLAFVAAWLTAVHPFWQPLLLAAPFASIQLSYDLRRRSRAVIAEGSGAVAITVLAAMLTLAGGEPFSLALLLWLLLTLWAIPAIIYVRVRLRLARGGAAGRLLAYLTHSGALAIVAGLAWFGLASWLTVAAFVVLSLRSVIGLLPRSLSTPTPVVGVQELIFSLLIVFSIALSQ